ncbi:hypothetical protein VB796_17525 [Arcicella sp. LKC2W]|uniref:hypothetical protein n=1 Tax=Arcicella sp. LKC2W TaxID=2984198 RepID=UPI002B200DAD|nr:hypothetical protein [Arcicella sp. LKC2W]MEA5460864.1 hypothetical protein [Arcicella sp. LKC2W]
MKNIPLIPENTPEALYCVEMEERLETINLPIGEIIENCCTKIIEPCLCICDCSDNNPTDDLLP